MNIELGYRRFVPTDQLNPFFHTCRELVNRVGVRRDTDWLMPNSLFSPTDLSVTIPFVLKMI